MKKKRHLWYFLSTERGLNAYDRTLKRSPSFPEKISRELDIANKQNQEDIANKRNLTFIRQKLNFNLLLIIRRGTQEIYKNVSNISIWQNIILYKKDFA